MAGMVVSCLSFQLHAEAQIGRLAVSVKCMRPWVQLPIPPKKKKKTNPIMRPWEDLHSTVDDGQWVNSKRNDEGEQVGRAQWLAFRERQDRCVPAYPKRKM
jgi:hypothetical protein